MKELVISISGLTRDVYNLYHQGGNFDLVMSNIERVKGFKNIIIHWIIHKDNEFQTSDARKWCKKRGFTYTTIRPNCEVEEALEGFSHPYLKTRPGSSRKLNNCKVQRWVPISVDGEYLLCCTSHNVKVGYTIWDNITYDELLQIKRELPFCKRCFETNCWKMF